MFTKKDLCECAWREVQKRKDFYPRMVLERKMTQATAYDQTEKMQAIYRILAAMPDDWLTKQ